jgi:hypothetical protein
VYVSISPREGPTNTFTFHTSTPIDPNCHPARSKWHLPFIPPFFQSLVFPFINLLFFSFLSYSSYPTLPFFPFFFPSLPGNDVERRYRRGETNKKRTTEKVERRRGDSQCREETATGKHSTDSPVLLFPSSISFPPPPLLCYLSFPLLSLHL